MGYSRSKYYIGECNVRATFRGVPYKGGDDKGAAWVESVHLLVMSRRAREASRLSSRTRYSRQRDSVLGGPEVGTHLAGSRNMWLDYLQ